MRKALVMPVVAAVMLVAACDGGTTAPTPSVKVRFFNATTGMTGNGGFTANGEFTPGSALASGQSASTCATLDAVPTSFAFGTANSAGTGLSGSALATLNNQSVTDGGNYTVVATGTATSPSLYMLDNNFPGTLPANQMALRFVNLAPGPDATANTYVVFNGPIGAAPPIATEIAVGSPTTFTITASGSKEFTILKIPGHDVVVEGTAGTLNLTAGTVNTVAIVQSSSGSYQLINLPRCS